MSDTSPQKEATRPKMRLASMFSEIAPLGAFFVVNAAYGLYAAAMASVLVSALLVGITWALEKRLARFALFATSIAAILTLAAIMAEEKTYIKIQPSLFNGAFALVLLGGALRGRAMMKVFFHAQFDLPERVWFTLSLRWGLFFAAATLANEAVWRTFSDDEWVFFRVFIMAPATGVFMLAQLPITLRGRRAQAALLREQAPPSA